MYCFDSGTPAANSITTGTDTLVGGQVIINSDVVDPTTVPEVELRHYYPWDILVTPVVRGFKHLNLSAPPLRHRAREDGL